jgi:hypothetical protein
MKEFYEDLIIEQNSVGWSMAEYNTKTDYIIEYSYIFVTTYDNCIHEFVPQDLPDFVQMYLTMF